MTFEWFLMSIVLVFTLIASVIAYLNHQGHKRARKTKGLN